MNKKFIPFFTLFAAGTLFAAHAHGHAHEHAEHVHATEEKHVHAEHENEAELDAHEHEHFHAERECDASHAHAEEKSSVVPVEISHRARESIMLRREKISDVPASEIRSYYGQIIVPASAMKTAALPAAGRVNFFVNPGEKICAGTLLFALESPALIEMQSDVRDAEAALARSETELRALRARLENLKAISMRNSELEAAVLFKEAEMKTLETAAQRSRALWEQATRDGKFENGVLNVFARHAGTVQTLDLNEGAWGDRGTSALTYAASGAAEFKTTVYGNDPLAGTSARLAITIGDETKYFAGTLRAAAQTEENSPLRTIYFRPENLPENVVAGQIARLEIAVPGKSAHGFVLVPNSAVIKVGVDDIVFVCDEKNRNKFFATKVETLPARRGMTPVSGVPAGSTIVAKGGYALKYALPESHGAPKKTAGHFHADGKFHEGEH